MIVVNCYSKRSPSNSYQSSPTAMCEGFLVEFAASNDHDRLDKNKVTANVKISAMTMIHSNVMKNG